MVLFTEFYGNFSSDCLVLLSKKTKKGMKKQLEGKMMSVYRFILIDRQHYPSAANAMQYL
jgi:hypothetical protein